MAEPYLAMTGVGKSFGVVQALRDVDFSVDVGEIHALLGENGAGKSTLIKVLMGAYGKDSGEIRIEGEPVHITSPHVAQELGLSAVYQDVMLARHLTVGENFFLGRLPTRYGLVDWKAVYARTASFLAELGIELDPHGNVGSLRIAQQQLVSIAKAAWSGARLLVFDEPTALLTNTEKDLLFELIRRLRAAGKSIIYISHRLEEVFDLCDRATVLRDGAKVATVPVAGMTTEKLVALMVGRDLPPVQRVRALDGSPVVLEVAGLSGKRYEDVSFSVRQGEILGLYGLVGAGRTDVMRGIFGADPVTAGHVAIEGRRIVPSSCGQMIQAGVGLVCEDRKSESLALPLDVMANINLVCGGRTPLGILERRKERATTQEYVEKLAIRTPSMRQIVRRLSGGNQQKVVIAKWLTMRPKVLLFDEPTIGVDVAARGEIYTLMRHLAEDGRAMVVVSSYLPELLSLCDRIMVMYQGRLAGSLEGAQATEERLLTLASGLPLSEDPSTRS